MPKFRVKYVDSPHGSVFDLENYTEIVEASCKGDVIEEYWMYEGTEYFSVEEIDDE